MVAADPILDENVPEEPSFSDGEYGFVESATDEELVGDILRKRPSLSEYDHCCIIVSGIPIVGENRLSKLKSVLGKIFGRIHPEFNDFYPVDDNGFTKACCNINIYLGYCFVEYPGSEVAENATAILHGYLLDKNHTFSANLFNDLNKFEKPDEDWKPLEPRPYNNIGDLWSWLQNEKCYDQFAVHYERDAQGSKYGSTSPFVGVYEYRKGQDPVPVTERHYWTETVFRWSPNGTFFVSVHRMGIALWAGANFERFARYSHENVIMLDFSPCERFLVTYSLPENRWADDTNSLRIFDTMTGEMRRGFSLLTQEGSNELPCWPYFQWSADTRALGPDETYLACPEANGFVACPKPGGNGINVYETRNFTLLDKKHVVIEGLRTFRWSPTRPILAYYCDERTSDNAPAEIGLMEIPSKTKLRAQRIFSVSEAELFWNKNGDRLAAHTERYQKKNIKTSASGAVEEIKYTNPTSHIEIFDARGKDISVLSMPLSESFIAFDWEPSGDKFCVLVGSQHKSTPLIYYLDTTKHAPQLISKFEPMERFSDVLWAPAGGWLVVFPLGSWDPTGRYFTAACTIGGGKGDTGYRIYTFQGRELYRKPLDRLMQFKWRPRLSVKLPDETIKMIRKNLKTTSAKFEEEDKMERGRATKEVSEKRKKIMADFVQIRNACTKKLAEEAELRLQLRGGLDVLKTDNEDLVEETITVPLTTEKVKLQEVTVPEE
ncbi:eukaryotic translation initiation factor 3 subunit B [Wuchereria bancrofti]|uniref:Eukaryotic translation initiation factor 3 subunit B n=1 Tax=Wuchereria bancrofti TaxID=6293 RepID=J9EQA9_WUCBA|nr:eukaryotic translation initiation factor 3 subunit B [Wuchereria bancrofti]